MGIRNYLIEGVSGAGKTTVATELERRGYQVAHGDRVLAYKGDPTTGAPVEVAGQDTLFRHQHHVWDIGKVRALVADHSQPVTFFCGGSRNFQSFVGLFDGVFVLEVDRETLVRRLAGRPDDEFGGQVVEQELILRLHATREEMPAGVSIDATVPVGAVVDDILGRCGWPSP